jgi:hypothetical protein
MIRRITIMKKFMIWLILAAIMITTVACGKEAVSETAQSDTAVSARDFSSLSFDEQYVLVKSSLPENDYEGYEFKFLTRAASISTRNIDLLAESIDGEPINDAVFERNTYIEDKYNIKIVDFYGSGADSASDALKFILADDDSFDVVSDGLNNLATILITNDALIDIYTIEGLKLDERWWDYKLINSFDIKGQSYLLTGDISICDDNFTMALLFNKQMITDYSLDDIYKLIADGSWTIDKMYDMAKTAAGDVNGDGCLV